MEKSKEEFNEILSLMQERGLTPEGIFPYSLIGKDENGELFVFVKNSLSDDDILNMPFNVYGHEDRVKYSFTF